MITFKESTHSLIESIKEMVNDKEQALLGLLGTAGATNLVTSGGKGLKDLYEKLPPGIKGKIERGDKLSPSEELSESNIIKRELKIPMRPNTNTLQALNEYYHETNPLSKSNYGNLQNTEDVL